MSIAGEQILRLLLWRRYVRRGKSLPLFWTELAQPEFDLVAYLSQQGLLDAQESVELQTLERAYLALYGGKTGDAVDALGGAAALRAILAGVPDEDAAVRSAIRLEYSGRFVPLGEFSPSDEPGHRYTHVSEYGSGGMGRVLIVHDRHLDRDIALKELLPPSEFEGELEDSPAHRGAAMAYRFLQEGMLTAQLEHPAIVPVYEIGMRRDGTPYYTMKLVRGRTLSEEIKRCRTARERLGLLPNFVTLCQAIAYAHGKGVLHRDIKPANVMVGDFGETVVLDWGIAKYRADKEPGPPEALARFKEKLAGEFGDEVYSLQGQTIGTPGYLSPEQARGQVAQIDERSDVFSLGVVLYELLSGKRAFEASSMAGLLDKTLKEEPPSLRKVAPSIPGELVSICERAMAKEPLRRYQKAQDLVRDLLAFQSGALVASHDYSFWDSLTRFYGRNRRVLQVAGAASLVVLCLGAFSFTSIWRARGEEHEQRVRAEEAEQQAVNNLRTAESALVKETFASRLASARLLNESLLHGRFRRVQELLDGNALDASAWETRHASAVMRGELVRLESSGSPVFQLELNAAADRALTLHNDGIARVWEVPLGTLLYESPPAVTRLTWGALSPGADSLALADASGRALVVDLARRETAAETVLVGTSCLSVAFGAEGEVLLGGTDGTLWAWPWRAHGEARALANLAGGVGRLWPLPGGARAVAQLEQGNFAVVDTASGAVVLSQPGSFQGFTSDGETLVSIHEGRIIAQRLSDGSVAWSSTQEAGSFLKAEMTPEGKVIGVGLGGRVLVYDAASGAYLNEWRAGEPILDALLSPDGAMLTTLDMEGHIQWVELAPEARVLQQAGGHLRDVMGLRRLGEHRVATYSFDGSVRIWELNPAVARLHQAMSHAEVRRIQSMAGSPGSPLLVAGDGAGTTRIINSSTGAVQAEVSVQSLGLPPVVASSTDGAMQAFSADGFSPVIVRSDALDEPQLLRGSRGFLSGLSFSPAHDELAAADQLGNVLVWSTLRPEDGPVWRAQCPEETLLGVAHLGDAGLIAVSYTGNLYRFSGRSLSLWDQAACMGGRVTCMGVSRRRGLVALGFADGAIEMRATDDLRLIDRIAANPNSLSQTLFDVSGNRLFTASKGTLQLWMVDARGKLHDTAFEIPFGEAAALVGAQEDLWFQDEGGAFDLRRTAASAAPGAGGNESSTRTIALASPAGLARRALAVQAAHPEWSSISFPFVLPAIAHGDFWDDWGLQEGDEILRMGMDGGRGFQTPLELMEALRTGEIREGVLRWTARREGLEREGAMHLLAQSVAERSVALNSAECEQFHKKFVATLAAMPKLIDRESRRLTEEWHGTGSMQEAGGIWVGALPPPPARGWFERLGLNRFDHIVEVNGKPLASAAELNAALASFSSPENVDGAVEVVLVVRRGAFIEERITLRHSTEDEEKSYRGDGVVIDDISSGAY